VPSMVAGAPLTQAPVPVGPVPVDPVPTAPVPKVTVPVEPPVPEAPELLLPEAPEPLPPPITVGPHAASAEQTARTIAAAILCMCIVVPLPDAAHKQQGGQARGIADHGLAPVGAGSRGARVCQDARRQPCG